MCYIIVSFCFLFLSVIEHIAWCRIKPAKGLRIISFMSISLLNAVFFLWALHHLQGKYLSFYEARPSVWYAPFVLTSLACYFVSLGLYFAFYSCTTIDSPSRWILRLVRDHGPMTYEDLAKNISNDNFIMTRLRALEEHGCVALNGKQYRLQSLGLLSAKLLMVYEKISGRQARG